MVTPLNSWTSPRIRVSLLCPVVGGAWRGYSKRHSYAGASLSIRILVIMDFQEHNSWQVSVMSIT